MKNITIFEVGDKVRFNGIQLGKEPILRQFQNTSLIGIVTEVSPQSDYSVLVKFDAIGDAEVFCHEELELADD